MLWAGLSKQKLLGSRRSATASGLVWWYLIRSLRLRRTLMVYDGVVCFGCAHCILTILCIWLYKDIIISQ